jgi:predicted acylesterase/phospholipase RssA
MESQSIVNNGRRTRSELKTNWLPSDLSKHPKQGDFNLAERKQYDEQIDAFYKARAQVCLELAEKITLIR